MEILAPSGNMESLKCAVYGGADAVYLGLDKFNARIKADNFTCDNISEAVRFCHIYGVKVYVTVNTNVKSNEYDDLARSISACNAANVDAFIVTDVGTLPIFDKYAPDIPLHASTQLGIHNAEGAIVAEKLGFSRIVVSRETLLSDIWEIKRRTSLEVEYFVHGALCVAFSGNCLMSSMISGNSGNRGLCLQPCRLEYECNNKRGYLLSASDQCLINELDELKQVGVDSLKIEGRARSAHYVFATVSAYRQMLDNGRVPKEVLEEMKVTFNRGDYTKGYNFDDTRNIMSPDFQGNIGVSCGKVVKSKGNRLYLRSERTLNNGDGLKIIFEGKELGGFSVNIASHNGDIYELFCDKTYPVDAAVRLTSYGNFSCPPRQLEVAMTFRANVGAPAVLTVSYKDIICVTVYGSSDVEQAKKVPTTVEEISLQLSKTGDSYYLPKSINIHIDNDIFIVKSHLNAMRRNALLELDRAILSEYDRNKERRKKQCYKLDYAVNKELDSSVMVELGEDNLPIEQSDKVAYVIFPTEFTEEKIEIVINKIKSYNNQAEMLLKLPNIARGNDLKIIRHILENVSYIDGLLCDNLYALELANEYHKIPMGGIGLNLYSEIQREMMGLINYIPSVEITLRESEDLCGKKYIYSYGKLPLMTLTHCPVRLIYGSDCSNCQYREPLEYIDRLGERFVVKRYKVAHCYFKLFNSRKLNAFAKGSMKDYNVYIDVDGEHLNGDSAIETEGITYGHLYKGVK